MIRIAVCDDEQCFVEQIYTILSVQAKEISSALHISTYMDLSLIHISEPTRH